jgi:hypothetical protein
MDYKNHNDGTLSTPISSSANLAMLLELASQPTRSIGNTSNGQLPFLLFTPPFETSNSSWSSCAIPQRASVQELLSILEMAIEIVDPERSDCTCGSETEKNASSNAKSDLKQ